MLNRLRALGHDGDVALAWAANVNVDGLSACEQLATNSPGPFCFGAKPSLADICLVPQLGNARRFKVDVVQFPRLLRAEAAAMELAAFRDATPDRQADAE